MRICMVTPCWFEYETGGTETYVKEFFLHCRSHFEEIHFVVPNPNSSRVKVEQKENIYVHKVPFLLYEVYKKNLSGRSRKLYEYLDKLVKEHKIDLFETESLAPKLAYFFSVNMVSIKYKIPLVERVHTFPKKSLHIETYKEMDFSKILCISKSVAETLFNEGVSAKKILTIYPSVDTSKFFPSSDNLREKLGYKKSDFVILHASRIATQLAQEQSTLEAKGIITALKALSIVLENNPDAKLLIAAAKPNEKYQKAFDKALKEINHYCEIYEISDKVKVESFDFEEMPKVYNTADTFILISEEETFGLVYAEAMACEKPVIGSSVTGIPEVITNSEEGYLVEPNNPVELAKRLTWLIQDPEKMKIFGTQGRQRVILKFEINKIMEELANAYKTIVKEHKTLLKN